jgi:hypothetical protein
LLEKVLFSCSWWQSSSGSGQGNSRFRKSAAPNGRRDLNNTAGNAESTPGLLIGEVDKPRPEGPGGGFCILDGDGPSFVESMAEKTGNGGDTAGFGATGKIGDK